MRVRRYMIMNYFITLLLIFLVPSILFSQNVLFEGSDASFSSNGKNIVYTSNNMNIWIADLATKKKQRVTRLINDNRASLSPDGKSIVFQSYGKPKERNQNFSIWIVNIDGSNLRKFFKEEGNDQYPLWSPDGTKIAWTHGKQIWIADIDGKNARPLTKDPAKEYEYVTDWSKDGKTILYARQDSYDGEGYKISLVDIDGNNQKRFDLIKNISCAKFTEDGKGIYYMQDDNQMNRVIISTGKTDLNLYKINNENVTLSFSFSPDFKSLIYDTSGPNSKPKVVFMKLP